MNIYYLDVTIVLQYQICSHMHLLLKQSNRQNIFDNATSNLNASPTNGFSVVLSELRVIFVGFPFSSSLKLIQPNCYQETQLGIL